MLNHQFRLDFAARFSSLLSKIGVSGEGAGRLEHVANLFGVSKTTAQKWLSGKTIPDPSRWPAVCTTLQCTLDELFFGHEGVGTRIPSGFVEMRVIESIKNCSLITRRILIEKDHDSLSKMAGYMLYKIADDKMDHYLRAGDYVIVDPGNQDPDACSAMLISICNHLMVRHTQLLLDGAVKLIPENKLYASETVPERKICLKDNSPRKGNACPLPTFVGAVVGRVLINR